MKIQYHLSVVDELEEICDDYDSQSPGLRFHLLYESASRFEQIAELPEIGRVVEGDIRCHFMKRFPCLLERMCCIRSGSSS